ncbi:MAG TPA: C40 family peptidase [Ramlibacter sp.]|nr:C40 family peptidase [Ramlibacter sp.]
MSRTRYARPVAGLALRAALVAACVARPARAQGKGFDLSYGRWWSDGGAILYSAGYHRPLLGPFDGGVALAHVDDHNALDDRTQTGAEVSLGIARVGRGPYAVGSAGFGLRHADGALEASWSAGLGWALPVFRFASVSLEARYRVEDQGARGFWRLQPGDRRGLVLMGRVAIGVPRAAAPPRAPAPTFTPPSEDSVEDLSRGFGAAPEAARVAADIVQTALDAMGTPYSWGGTDANGYDCSGLVQYAYEQHGIILPRISRDQMRMGRPVEPRLDALRPGDVLGFSVEGNGVTHVGLYVGDGRFIHSASEGVKLSSLSATDADSEWWRRHWIAARRIVQ